MKEAPQGLGATLWNDENTVLASDQSRLAYIDSITITELVLKGGGQVPPPELVWHQGDTGSHVEESIGTMGADLGGSRPDEASIHHRFDRGLTSTLSNEVQYHIEEA